MQKDKFFFEEDPESQSESGMSWGEHAESFFGTLQEIGVGKDVGSGDMAPMGVEEVKRDVKTKALKLASIEYGVVGSDYAIHITPTHPKYNLSHGDLYSEALIQSVKTLNKVVPQTLAVDIYHPQPDWEIKAMSFVIRGAADRWNFDVDSIESVIDELLQITETMCTKAPK